jgi:DNA-binding CsgD family transcriptional regulator
VEHLKIAYYLVVLLVGVAAVSYTILTSRAYRLPFLTPFAYFLGFNNGLALVNLTSAYACANLLGFCALFQYSVFATVLGPVARLSSVGIVYALYAVALGFGGRRPSRSFDRWYGAGALLLFASYVVSALLGRGPGPGRWIARAQLLVFLAGVLAILAILAGLWLASRKIGSAAERKAVRTLAASYLAVYIVFVATFALPTAIQFFPNALALLAINVVPFVWFRKLFPEAYVAPAASANDPSAFESFCRTRGLTPRESEVLALIIRGRSNAQIERELFISGHTVKNHITNLHQKLGVRTRWQLIGLFQERPARAAASEARPEEIETPAFDRLRPQ